MQVAHRPNAQSRVPGRSISPTRISHQINGEPHQIRERAMLQRALTGRAQYDFWRGIRLKRLLPARRAQTPAIAGLQAGETVIRHRRGQVVAGLLAERQEFLGHDNADGVTANVLGPGIATPVAKKAGHRVGGANVQNAAQYVAGWPASGPAACFV